MNGWISTSERHPNHAGQYFATIKKNNRTLMGIVSFRINKKVPEFYNQFTQETYDVIAWMKLPKPYKEGK